MRTPIVRALMVLSLVAASGAIEASGEGLERARVKTRRAIANILDETGLLPKDQSLEEPKESAGRAVAAAAQAEGIARRMEQSDPYEVLKTFYESSDVPAEPADFSAAGEPNRWTCLSVMKSEKVFYPSHIRRMVTKLFVHGSPAAGPLFPGSPDRDVPGPEKVVMTGCDDPDCPSWLPYNAYRLENRMEGKDFIIHADADMGWANAPFTTHIRKTKYLNKPLIVYHLVESVEETPVLPGLPGAARTLEDYGYCY